jgi:diaminohydroxyphosphoribosylaminopyrimidine deaminase/5-amino-6-(5-phosphoribosylamino)uracil reductase
VGIKTVLADNPRLTSRLAGGRNPIRIVMDPSLDIPLDSDIVSSAKEVKSIIVTSKSTSSTKYKKKKELLKEKGLQLIEMELKNSQFKIADLMKKLYSQGIFSLMVEGGAEIAASFLKAGVVNKCHFFISPKILGDGKSGLNDLNIKSLKRCLQLKNVSFQRFEDDMLMSGDL